MQAYFRSPKSLCLGGLRVVVAALLSFAASPAAANAVDDWHAIARQTIVINAARGGAVGVVDLAYVQVAVYDAVNAIDKRYTSFAVSRPDAPGWASPEAATAAAAHAVLRWMFPAQGATLDATYAAYLAALPAGPARDAGAELGAQVGALFAAQRTGDGRNAVVPCHVSVRVLGSTG